MVLKLFSYWNKKIFIGYLLFITSPLLSQRLDSNWVILFNETDFTGWYSYVNGTKFTDPDSDPNKNFVIINGTIEHKIKTGSSQASGYLATNKKYIRYHFKVDYKFAENCNASDGYCKNSGILHNLVEDGIWPVSIECNMYNEWPTTYGGIGNGDIQVGSYDLNRGGFGNRTMEQYASKTEWNTMEVLIYGDTLHIAKVNGETGIIGRDVTYKGSPLQTGGYIALQIEGNDVSFRNVKIRDIDEPIKTWGCMDSNAINFVPTATHDDSSCHVPVIEYTGAVNKFVIATSIIKFNLKSEALLRIVNTKGNIVLRKTVLKMEQINISHFLRPGVYQILLNDGGQLFTKKHVVY